MDQNQNGVQPNDALNAAGTAEQTAAPETENVSSETASEAAENEAQPEAAEGEAETAESTGGEAVPAQPKKNLKLTIALAAIVALLAVAAIFLASALKTTKIAHENEQGYLSYTMTEEQATKRVMDQKVASCGSWEMTNSDLAYYYWEQYYSFASQYGQYLAYLMDTSLGLDEQLYDDDTTWQQQFLDGAVKRFGMVAAVCQEAEANGYTLDEDAQSQLDSIRDNLTATAEAYGFEDADAIVRDAFGPKASVDGYIEFIRRSLLASNYLNDLVEGLSYTDEDLSAYYDEHADEYAAQGLQKIDKPMVNIRHILITPSEQDENGEYTEAAWAAAEEEANRIYAEWEASDKTEDTFAQMAMQYSQDPGSQSNGGLYEDVYPGMMVEEFNDWCFADGRSEADYGMVKTSYGYHIMFYSGTSDEIYWTSAVREDYLNDQASSLLDEICSRYPVTSDLDKAGILPLPSDDASASDDGSAGNNSENTDGSDSGSADAENSSEELVKE